MATVYVARDELYPYMVLFQTPDPYYRPTPILVLPATLARWNRAIAEFKQVNREILAAEDAVLAEQRSAR